MNYFELFGFPVSFSVDQTLLNKQYIALQKKFHPDFFGDASQDEKAYALEQSSLINNGYKTLKDKDLTLQYFLQMKGLIKEGEAYKLPADFLMEVMELNEMKMDGAEKEEIDRKAAILFEEIYAEVRPLFQQYDDLRASETDLMKIKDYYYKKKYIDRLLAE